MLYRGRTNREAASIVTFLLKTGRVFQDHFHSPSISCHINKYVACLLPTLVFLSLHGILTRTPLTHPAKATTQSWHRLAQTHTTSA